jgi:hypothetical protein
LTTFGIGRRAVNDTGPVAGSHPVAPDDFRSRTARGRDRSRVLLAGRWVTLAALTLIAVQLAIRSILVSRSWFLVDDFVFLADIARGIDDFGWYTRIHQGHFMPLSFGLVKIGSFFGPWSWAAAATQIIVLQALASVGCWLMLRILFGNRPAILLGLGFYLFSPLTIPTVMWWAVAINQLPHQIACFGAISAHVVFLRSRRWAPALAATAFLVLGYASYTKTLLLPVVLVIVTMAYFTSGTLPRRTWDAVRDYWRAWVLYLPLSIGFVIVYLGAAPATASPARTSLAQLAESSVLESFGSTTVGGPWRWTPFGAGPIAYGAAPQLGVVVGWLLMVGFVVWAWSRSERTLRALWAPAFYIAASIVLVFVGRAFYLVLLGSSQVGRQVQYFSDAAPVVAMSIVSMVVPIVGAIDPLRRRGLSLVDVRPPRHVTPVLVGVLLIGLLTSSMVTSVRYAKPWTSNYLERNFTTTAHATILREDPLLADSVVPPQILSEWSGDQSLIGSYFAPMRDAVRVTRTGNDLRLLDVEGATVPAEVDATDRSDADGIRSCPIRIKGRARTIRITPVLNYPFWMAIDYRSDTTGVLPLVFGSELRQAPIEAGRHTLFVKTQSAYATVSLRPLAGQELCVSAVRVGNLVAEEAP